MSIFDLAAARWRILGLPVGTDLTRHHAANRAF